MPRRHVARSPSPSPSIWGVNFVVIHVGLDTSLPCSSPRCASCLVALALPFVPRPGVPVRYVVAVGVVPLRRPVRPAVPRHRSTACRPAWPRSCCSCRPRSRSGSRCCCWASARARRSSPAASLALAGIGVIAAGRAEAVPLGALALTIGAAACWGLGNVATRKARSPHPRRPARVVEPVPPLPLLALSLMTETRRAGRRSTPRGVLALLYVVGLSTFVGFGAWAWLLGRHPASDRRPVHAAGARSSGSPRPGSRSARPPPPPSSAARRWCSPASRSPWACPSPVAATRFANAVGSPSPQPSAP